MRQTVFPDPAEYRPTPFTPAWWLPGRHLQTLGARFLRSPRGVPFRRERLTMSDGDFVDVDFAFPDSDHANARPLVLVLHGLEGSARSKYALEVYRRLHARGVSAVGLNFRSCSGELNTAARLYHSGDTGDLHAVVEILRERFPQRRFALAGFSLGGNVVLKYLGEQGAQAADGIVAAAAVSVPYDLSLGASYLERFGGRLYAGYLLRKLQRKIAAKAQLMPPRVDVQRAAAARTLRVFDDAATAPLHGFRDAEDYYARSSSAAFVPSIRVPTLLIHAEDDPFLPAGAIPREGISNNAHLVRAIVPDGGHVGFVGRSLPWRPFFWAEAEVARFLAAALFPSASGDRRR